MHEWMGRSTNLNLMPHERQTLAISLPDGRGLSEVSFSGTATFAHSVPKLLFGGLASARFFGRGV